MGLTWTPRICRSNRHHPSQNLGIVRDEFVRSNPRKRTWILVNVDEVLHLLRILTHTILVVDLLQRYWLPPQE
jgi:hypothetical protein